jgi:peptidyl-tRNA hydrolase, PTH2 family
MTEPDIKQVIVVRKDLNMRKGKIAAQVAHASIKFLVENNESERSDELFVKLSNEESIWVNDCFKKVVVSVDSEDELENLILRGRVLDIEVHSIIDSGLTEFGGQKTLTCAAFGPTDAKILDTITGHLKLM